MPKFLCRTHSHLEGHGDADTSEMDSAVLEIDDDFLELCRRREQLVIAMHAQDTALFKCLFRGRFVDWYEFYPDEAEENCLIPVGGCEAADDGELLPFNSANLFSADKKCSTEFERMQVVFISAMTGRHYCEFSFTAYRKHCGVLVSTPPFDIEQMEVALRSKQIVVELPE